MYKISLIITAYNEEKFIERGVNSIINQTIGFENIELIIADDNSSDSTPKIIKELGDKYENIKPIFLYENSGGCCLGRNEGLDIATADYIMFMDADDEYEEDMCETLYNTIISEDADYIRCGWFDKDEIHSSKSKPYNENSDMSILTNEEALYLKVNTVWNNIFKKSIIDKNNIRFIIGERNEDTLFSLEYYLCCKKLIYLNNYYGYIHITKENSLSSPTYEYTLNLLESYLKIKKILEETDFDVDYERIFKPKLENSIVRTIRMDEISNKRIKTCAQLLKDVEYKLGLKDIKLNNPLFNFINQLILKNHNIIALILIKILNKCGKSKSLLKIHRKIFRKIFG